MFRSTYNDINATDLLKDIGTHAEKNALKCPLGSIMEHFAPANLTLLLLSCYGVNHELQRLSHFSTFWWLGQETGDHHSSLSMPTTNRSKDQHGSGYRASFTGYLPVLQTEPARRLDQEWYYSNRPDSQQRLKCQRESPRHLIV